jgi:hypothetical protein
MFADGDRDRNGLEILGREQCLRLLARVEVGRLGYVRSGVPAVVPVMVALDGERLLFRLTTGAALAAICAGQLLVLEVDEIDRERGEGWSVNVVGLPVEVPGVLARALGECVTRPPGLRAGRLFELDTRHIEGRRTARSPGPVRSPPLLAP